MKFISIIAIVCFTLSARSQTSTQAITTSWGNYINTNIAGYGSTILQVTMDGQNSVWNGVFSIQSINAWTPDITWNNVKLISYSGYNSGVDDIKILIMSSSPSNDFGPTTIVIKSETPATGSASIRVVALGANASSLSLSAGLSSPFTYVSATSAGTFNTWTVNKKVGIGTIAPTTLLDLGDLKLDKMSSFPAEGSISEGDWPNYIIGDAGQKLRLGVSNDLYTRAEIFLDNSNRQDGTIAFKTTSGSGGALTRMFIDGNGNAGIGTMAPGPYKLAVEGTIGARKVKVTQVSPWADYVFNDDYRLMSLKELDDYIHKNKHLPDVPSAKEVEQNGLDLGDNQAILLKKIEELTLYIIGQDKRIEKLEIVNKQLELEKQAIKVSRN